jgi:hypothetical protein
MLLLKAIEFLLKLFHPGICPNTPELSERRCAVRRRPLAVVVHRAVCHCRQFVAKHVNVASSQSIAFNFYCRVSLELSGIICSSCDVAPKRWSIRAEGRSLRRTGVLPGDMFERHVVVVPDDGRSEVSPGRLLPRVIGRRPDPFTTRDGGVHNTSSTTTFISITYQPPLSSSPTPLSATHLLHNTTSFYTILIQPSLPSSSLPLSHPSQNYHFYLIHPISPSFFLFLNTHFHLLRTLYPSQYYTSLVSTSYPYQPFSEHTHYSFTFSPPLFNSSNP